MKRWTRTITVNDKKYIWWCRIDTNDTQLVLSPERDKTSTISVSFAEENGYGNYTESVVIKKNGAERCVKIVEPAMAGLVLPYLQEQETFITRKHLIVNGFELLSKMGYEVTETKEGCYW